MDTPDHKSKWAGNIKDLITYLANEAQTRFNHDIPIAWNGALCRTDPQKRTDTTILDPGNTTFVCTYLPLLYSICGNILINYYINLI